MWKHFREVGGHVPSRPSAACDLVDRKLTRDEPNKLWLTDIAEYSTPWTQEREGRTYCAVVKGHVFEEVHRVVKRQFEGSDV